MEWTYIHFAAVISAFLFAGIAVFQVLLTLGYPLGEATMGGRYKILPKPYRFVSALSAVILIFMGIVILQHAQVGSIGFDFLSTYLLVWGITIYLAFNTVANLLSKSKKEQLVMTPLSGVAFLLCLLVAVS